MTVFAPQKPADDTYDLPRPGEMDSSKLSKVAQIGQRFGVEAGTQRNRHIGLDSRYIHASENLYRFGHQDGSLSDVRPTVNRIKKTQDSFVANSNRTPANIVIKSASVNEDGYWVMKKPFTFSPPIDPQTGQPKTNPSNGQPFQPVQLNPGDEIPDDIIDFIPSHRRLHINTETVVKWEQATFDVLRREIDYDDTIRQSIDYKQKLGWLPRLFEWDPITERPQFKIFPLQQWFLDPIQTDIAKMNRLRLDMVIDAAEALRLYPQAAEAINASAMRSVKYAPGSMGYSDIYIGDTTFATPVVTMMLMWLRNVEVHMTLAEARHTGMVTQEEPPEQTEQPAEELGEGAGGEADSVDEDALSDETAKPRILHAHIKDTNEDGEPSGKPLDLTDSFDDEGNPAEYPHPNHPRKLVTMQWIQIESTVVPGTYIECPHWDINVSLDKNSEIMFRPFGDPDTVYLKSPQYIINSMYQSMVDHAEWFKGPAGIMSKELSEVAPDLKDGYAKPGNIYTVDVGALGDKGIAAHFLELQPPPMTQALPLVLDHVTRDYERIADAGVNNGTPPPGVTAASAIANLQNLSQSTNDLKSMHTEKAIRRDVKLWLHAQTKWMSIEAILKINRSIPENIVRQHIKPFRDNILWDVEVSIPTGGGMVEQQKKAQVRADVQIGLLDKETARDELGYDSAEISRREKEEFENQARMQAEAAQASAPPQQQKSPMESLSINYKDAPPDIQRQMEQAAGFQPSQLGATVDHQLAAAKIQNEANRTAVDAHAKQHQMAMSEKAANQPEPAGE